MERNTWYPTEAGTPQGGLISPLLCNIALHGMEDAIGVEYRPRKGYRTIKEKCTKAVIRYADDFCVLCDTKNDAQEAKTLISEWLKQRGLQLSEEKTKISHIEAGIDFLGFSIRRYRGKNGRVKNIIKPSQEAILKLKAKLRSEWRKLKNQDVKMIIKKLNPIIRGWANYYRHVVSSEIFSKLDHFLFQRQVKYVNHRHPNKPWKWKRRKYWGKLNTDREDKWVFGDTTPLLRHPNNDKDEISCCHLTRFSWVKIQRHVLVKDTASPDDPKLKEYWESRRRKGEVQLRKSDRKIASKQKGKCPVCNDSLLNGEELQKHHIIPTSEGGNSSYKNLQLVHYFCHQQLHGS